MLESAITPFHTLPSGLCEDASGEGMRLIQRMAARDGAALTELHSNWCPILTGIALRMMGERREAEELVRGTFVQMWKRAETYDPHRVPPFVWAFVIMRGLVLERLKRRKRGKGEKPIDPAPAPMPRTAMPKVLTGDDCRRLRTAMDQLDLEERNILEQAVFLGYAVTPEAGQTAAAPATVKNHLRRALETLCNQLSRHEL